MMLNHTHFIVNKSLPLSDPESSCDFCHSEMLDNSLAAAGVLVCQDCAAHLSRLLTFARFHARPAQRSSNQAERQVAA